MYSIYTLIFLLFFSANIVVNGVLVLASAGSGLWNWEKIAGGSQLNRRAHPSHIAKGI